MKTTCAALRLGLVLLGALVFSAYAGAQAIQPFDKIQNQQDLDKAIAALDAAVFDAFNRCELDKLGAFYVEDVEF